MMPRSLSPSFLIALLLSITVNQAAYSASSRSGNGGDVATMILEQMRQIMLNGIKAESLTTRDFTPYCRQQLALNQEQVRECAAFITQAMPQILALHAPQIRNRLVPVKQLDLPAVETKNQAGRCQQTPWDTAATAQECLQPSAWTTSGAEGDIAVTYSFLTRPCTTIRSIIAVLFHEFGHKVLYTGRFLEDSDHTQAFDHAWQLLDAAGLAFAAYVEATLPNLPERPKVIDRFLCHQYVNGKIQPDSLFKVHDVEREFIGKGESKYEAYRTGICLKVANCPFLQFAPQGAVLMPVFTIVEKNNCRDATAAAAKANNTMEFRLVTPQRTVGPRVGYPDPIPFENPICQNSRQSQPFMLEYEDIKMECRYEGTKVQAD